MPQFSDDLFLGSAPTGILNTYGSGGFGVGPMGRVYFHNIVPLTLGTTNVAAAQTLAGAGSMVLTAGTGVTQGSTGLNVTQYVLDVPRCVSLTCAGNMSGVNFTLTALDQYGVQFTALIAGPNANTVTFPKAAKAVLSISASGAVGTNVSAGTSDIFGLPFACASAEYITSVKWAGALAQDAGTLVVADATSPATNATGDVRGTYKPSSASNGTRRLVIAQHLTAIQSGPNATLIGALGQTQV